MTEGVLDLVRREGVSMPEASEKKRAETLIDFSGREDEYLDTEILQKALAWAIITSVLGFVFSAWLFLARGVGPAADILERTQAKGSRSTETGLVIGEDSGGFVAFRAPRMKKFEPVERRVDPALKKKKRRRKKRPKPTKAAKKVAAVNIGGLPDYKRKSSVKLPPRRKRSKAESLDRLLFPRVDDRPSKKSQLAIDSILSDNVIALGTLRGKYEVGLGLDSEGRAIVAQRVARPECLTRVWYRGTLRRARVLNSDGALGLALIKVEGASFSEVPLSPSPPSTGDRLYAFLPGSRNPSSQAVRAGRSFGQANFFVRGPLSEYFSGALLINERGELSGLHVQSLPGALGSGLHLASDSAALYRLVRGYQGSGSSRSLVGAASRRIVELLDEKDSQGETKRGRVIPGVGLSNFALGMDKDDALSSLSTPEIRSISGSIERVDSPAPPVSLYFVQGKLALAGTSHNGFSTPEGLSTSARVDADRLAGDYPPMESSSNYLICPGLDVEVKSGTSVSQFVVYPELTKP